MDGEAFPVDTAALPSVGWVTLPCKTLVSFLSWPLLTSARFLAGQMHVFRPRVDLARVLVALAPLVGAALIAVSRCEDYRHDVYDVTVGSLLGTLIAHSTYRRYYPTLKSLQCDTPYPDRMDTSKSGSKARDEEDGILEEEDEIERIPLQTRNRSRSRGV
jgi:diacylglycerol diphosphate phosphatase/phosphatidate phosphatase